MTTAAQPTVARPRRVDVPEAIRSREDLAGSDYASAFALAVRADSPAPTPEQWARAAFEGAPAPLLRLLPLAWRLGLGLRLGPRPSPGHVLGWSLTGSDTRTATLTARSGLLTAHNVVALRDNEVVRVTLVRFERRAARPLWAVAAPIHHLTVPYLLARAARASAAQSSTSPASA